MLFKANTSLAFGYKSGAQQARLISEGWVAQHAYCLNCDSDSLAPTATNTRTRDFVCPDCRHGYELKSKRGPFTNRIPDGAYGAMLRTIREGRTPTFLLLEYSSAWSIEAFKAIHHSLITEATIQARKPLSESAKRAGWIGCNILLPSIAIDGQIPILQNGTLEPKAASRKAFARVERLSALSPASRSWAGTILRLLHDLPGGTFSLSDIYKHEPELANLYPSNKHIRPKIRQQLQVLRDAGLVTFTERGKYELVHKRERAALGRLV